MSEKASDLVKSLEKENSLDSENFPEKENSFDFVNSIA